MSPEYSLNVHFNFTLTITSTQNKQTLETMHFSVRRYDFARAVCNVRVPHSSPMYEVVNIFCVKASVRVTWNYTSANGISLFIFQLPRSLKFALEVMRTRMEKDDYLLFHDVVQVHNAWGAPGGTNLELCTYVEGST
jgi:hypothetical protein